MENVGKKKSWKLALVVVAAVVVTLDWALLPRRRNLS
jgi:hypothetical protein